MARNFLGIAGFSLLLLTLVESVKVITHIPKSCLLLSPLAHDCLEETADCEKAQALVRGAGVAHA